jgi:hypothetical protein
MNPRNRNSNNFLTDFVNNLSQSNNANNEIENEIENAAQNEADSITSSYMYRKLLVAFPFLVCLMLRFLFSYLLKFLFITVVMFSLFRLDQVFSELQAAQVIAKQSCKRLLIVGLVQTAVHLSLLLILVPLIFHDQLYARLLFLSLNANTEHLAKSFDYCLWMSIVTDLTASGFVVLIKLMTYVCVAPTVLWPLRTICGTCTCITLSLSV